MLNCSWLTGQINILLSAGASQRQAYILYPLVCGYVNLPKLRLVAFPDSPAAQPLDALVDSALPQFIQIMVSCSSPSFHPPNNVQSLVRSRKGREWTSAGLPHGRLNLLVTEFKEATLSASIKKSLFVQIMQLE